jgi:ATP-dependent Zn protease
VNLRNTLFPLIVIVLLAYLASQNLMGGDERKVPYSEVRRLVFSDPQRVDELTFRPKERIVVLNLTNGTTFMADYPRASTPPAFEPPMAQGADRDAKDTGSWWARGSTLTSLLPFILLFGFGVLVVVLGRRNRRRISNEDFRAT